MRVEKYNGGEYLPDVKFSAKPANGGRDYLQCDGCHKCTTATAVTLPKTLFYDGIHLTPKYTTYWFCPDCMQKLREAVKHDG